MTAAWIEFEIRSPGAPERVHRREIFDFVGPAARSRANPPAPQVTRALRLMRGFALLGETEFLLLPTQLSTEFVQDLLIRRVLANLRQRGRVLNLAQSQDPSRPKDLIAQLAKLDALPGPLYALALARHSWARTPGDHYLDRSNVLTFSTRLKEVGASAVSLFQEFDIVANEMAVRFGADANFFALSLEQGVLDTNAEARLLVPLARLANTAELFGASNRQRIEWVLIRSVNDPVLRDVALAPEPLARIRETLTSGYWVYVPRRPVRLDNRLLSGWWRIDPRCGDTLGIMESGKGQTATEKIVVSAVLAVPGAVASFLAMGGCVGYEALYQDPRAASVDKWALCSACALVVGVATSISLLLLFVDGPVGGAAVGFMFDFALNAGCNAIDTFMQ